MKNKNEQSKIKLNMRIGMILLTIFFSFSAAQAVTFTVINTNDSGPGSLRQTILDANAGAPDIYTINFDSSLSGQTIMLTSGELSIAGNNPLFINGLGANLLTISGNNNHRVFFIEQAANVTINGITITGGSSNVDNLSIPGSGGGIFNNGSLTIDNSIISGNSANFAGGDGGGIYSLGRLIIRNSTIRNNSAENEGGGIYINNSFGSSQVLLYSTINDNSARSGGGIYNSNSIGETQLIGSTISDSSAEIGGGIYNYMGTFRVFDSTIRNNSADLQGGGIYNDTAELTLTGSTISHNMAEYGGGIHSRVGGVGLINSTVSSNTARQFGGGISNGSSNDEIILFSSTIAFNTAAIGGGISTTTVKSGNSIIASNIGWVTAPDISGEFNSQGFNLIGSISGIIFLPTDVIAPTNILGVNPLLGPLADNGGPTFTHRLLPGSPAIDKGNSGDSINDQRGFDRPVNIPSAPDGIGNLSDIGAFEVQLIGPLTRITDLVELTESYNLHRGIQSSLLAKLNSARRAFEAGNLGGARGSMNAFINHVEAQSGKKIPAQQATNLILSAEEIVELLLPAVQ